MSKTSKIGYGDSNNLSNAIASGAIDERDLIVTKDTHELFFIDDNKNKIVIESRLNVYNSVLEANDEINKTKTTYAGKPIIIREKDKFSLYIVQLNEENNYYLQKITNDEDTTSIPAITSIDWKDITNIPNTANTDNNTTYKLTQDTENNKIILIGSDGVKYEVNLEVFGFNKENLKDTDTKYQLKRVGDEIRLIDSDNAYTKVDIKDTNTTYSLELTNDDTIVLTDSNGKTTSVPLNKYINTNTTYNLIEVDGKVYLQDNLENTSKIGIPISVAATNSNKGYVIVGNNIDVKDDGTISIDNHNVENALGYRPNRIVTSSDEPNDLSVGDYWVTVD